MKELKMERPLDGNVLEDLKEIRFNEIDNKTISMIDNGFVFNGKTFSLSAQAQNNWTNIKANKATFSAMGLFPLQISTKDSDLHDLTEAEVDSFWGAGLAAVKGAYNDGGLLKKAVKDATTISEVNAIIDNR